MTVRPHPSAARLAFRPDVEGLRGVAILLVVLYHAGVAALPGGFVGVDVFFALSGFLITRLLVDELTAAGRVDLAAFYARRVRRLLPASAATLVGTVLLAAALYPPLQVAEAAEAGRAAAAFLSNAFFAGRATDYFADGVSTTPLLHTWSLSVEEQFYLAWPCVVWLAAGRQADRRRLGLTLVALGAASLTASWWYTYAARSTAFFGMPTRAWEFAAGALVALLPAAPNARAMSRMRALRIAIGWIGLALIAAAAIGFSARTPFPGTLAGVPVLGTALVLHAATTDAGSAGWLLARTPLQWIGRHSYGWYLWHWPLLVLGGELVPNAGVAARLAIVLAALGLAVATRVWIEDPIRYGRLSWQRSWPTIGAGATAVAALVLGTTGLRARAARASQDPAQAAYGRAARDIPRVNGDGCAPTLTDSVVRVCEYGLRSARTTVALFGDSHAAHWMPALERLARDHRWRLLVVTKSACPSVDAPLYEPVLQRAFTECAAWRRAAFDSLRARRPAMLVVSNSAEYVIDATRPEERASVTPREWERGMRATLAALRLTGAALVVLQDVPHAVENVPRCLRRAAWRGRPEAACETPRDRAVHHAAAAAVRRAVDAFPGGRLIDLAGAMCSPTTCAAVQDGIVRYRDARHLTASASAQLAPVLGRALDGAGPGTLYAERAR